LPRCLKDVGTVVFEFVKSSWRPGKRLRSRSCWVDGPGHTAALHALVHQAIGNTRRAFPDAVLWEGALAYARARLPRCREGRVLDVPRTVLTRGSQSQAVWRPRVWALSLRDLLHEDRPHLRSSELHLLVVPLLGRASDPVAIAESGAVRLAGHAGAGVVRNVGRARDRGRRHTPRSTSRVGA
jgi:hypothetical protein